MNNNVAFVFFQVNSLHFCSKIMARKDAAFKYFDKAHHLLFLTKGSFT